MEKEIENIINVFFSKLNLNINSIELKKEKENIFLITIKTDDKKESSLIIGPHGKNLEFIKSLLKLIISKNLNKNVILHLEVNDYLQSKDDKLIKLVSKKIDLVKKIKKDVGLPFLSSYERKKVHSYVADEAIGVFTESRGKGKERKLYICYENGFEEPEKTKKSQKTKLSIDINGNDI
ncbi:hypothetical protein CSB07_01495 [Candidatus Gracilibacteria bacterium]|nr:MAG: hypothetical protein CSB07_01495 [Candidatus Gracilibacteria bacterium]